MLFEGAVPTTYTKTQEGTATSTGASANEVNELSVTGEVHASRPHTLLRLGNGEIVQIPTALLLQGNTLGESSTPTSASSDTTSGNRNTAEGEATTQNDEALTIPILAERAEVGKRTVKTGTVRLHKSTETFTEEVSMPLTKTSWDVQRSAVGEWVPERPEVRQEGDVTVFPLVEERLVAKREYFLIEEVRVRRTESTTERTASVELKRDVLTVERETADDAAQV